MGDVVRPGQSTDEVWLRSLPVEARARFLWPNQKPPTDDHLTGVRVGVLGMAMQCLTCGTVCMPRHESMVLTDTETGEQRTIPGAWVGPPDDPHGHFFPFRGLGQDNTDPQLATEERAPKPRPAGIPETAHRSKSTPSRSPEARHKEYLRAKRTGRR